jgi:hypothetical protein
MIPKGSYHNPNQGWNESRCCRDSCSCRGVSQLSVADASLQAGQFELSPPSEGGEGRADNIGTLPTIRRGLGW